jgi:hypothetical protein
MNKAFRTAQTLPEVARQATLEPLKPGDPRYVDLSAGQEARDLRLLRQYVEDQNADERRYALATFSGHRGCGKTTQPYQSLARIHESKSLPEPEATDQHQLQQARAFYADLLIKGVVLDMTAASAGTTCTRSCARLRRSRMP